MDNNETTSIEIVFVQKNLGVTSQQAERAIFCEDRNALDDAQLSKVKLCGKYNRTYTFVTTLCHMWSGRMVIDGDLLLVAGFSEIGIIDLAKDRLVKTVTFDCDVGMTDIHPFGSGFFIIADDKVGFLTRQWNIAWSDSGIDLFFNTKVECNPQNIQRLRSGVGLVWLQTHLQRARRARTRLLPRTVHERRLTFFVVPARSVGFDLILKSTGLIFSVFKST